MKAIPVIMKHMSKSEDGAHNMVSSPAKQTTYEKAAAPIYSKLTRLEDKVDKSLDYPMKKGHARSKAYTEKHGGNWVDSDKITHAAAGMHTRKAISKKLGGGTLGNIAGAVGANVLGVGHELSAFNNDHGYINGAVEAGKDIVNNFIGSVSSSKNLERNVNRYGTSGMSDATRKERTREMNAENALQKRKSKTK
jgi:hypothetical protein